MQLTLREIRTATGGSWHLPPVDENSVAGNFTDDSRQVTEGAVFFALSGAYTDGHEHIIDAARAGAAVIVAEKRYPRDARHQVEKVGAAMLLVDDSLKAFHAVALQYRLRAKRLLWVVAVTGSNGKTSIKEMIAAVFERQWPGQVLKTKGNTNNHFGVPRNLFRLTDQTRAAVLEVGCNRPGEIGVLADLIRPNMGVISNIGRAHIENFPDVAGIAREKSELLARLPKNGIAVLPAGDPYKDILFENCAADRQVTFGIAEDADVRVSYKGRSFKGYQVSFTRKRESQPIDVSWDVPGCYQAINAGAAIAAATAAGVPLDTAVAGLRGCTLPSMRLEVGRAGQFNWVNDAYNANPESVRAGVECFLEVTARTSLDQRRFIVLGDMLELGKSAHAEHVGILEWCAQLPDCRVVAIGERMSAAATEVKGVTSFTGKKQLCTYLSQHLQPNDWVFLKGSRQMRMEDIMTEVAFRFPESSNA